MQEMYMEALKDKKRLIIQAATRLFMEQGVKNTTVSDIAKAAGIGKGTIYYYYEDKAEILKDCYQRHVQAARKRAFAPFHQETDLMLRLQRVLYYISEEHDHDPFISTLLSEYREHRSPEIKACLEISQKDAIRVVSTILQEGIKEGQFKDLPLPLTSFLLVQMFSSFVAHYKEPDRNNEEFLQIIQAFLHK